MSVNYVHEVQDTRLVVQGSRIEFGVYCDWCGGYGCDVDFYGDIVDCHKCDGSGFKFHYVVGGDDAKVETST